LFFWPTTYTVSIVMKQTAIGQVLIVAHPYVNGRHHEVERYVGKMVISVINDMMIVTDVCAEV